MPRVLRRLGRATVAGASFAVAGCFTLARPTPPLEEYVLGAVPPAAVAAPARESGAVTVGLRRIDLAPYLATTAIVVRRGSRIVTSGFRRWGEEPGAGILRAVASSLGTAPSIAAVDAAPWPVGAPHDYLIQLHVSHLEGVASEDAMATEGEVQLSASWEIIRSPDGALVARGETARREKGWKVGDYAGLVTRVDSGLAGLASDLAACLSRITSAKAPPDAPSVPLVCATR
ncbi:MAG: membrane integrity-associated transporter subunit PqiC [Gemmatimonadetes bacterium]|nr:membrane integrity-associated transporter subunit PqiC [Gemmatimonadota bacterium]